MLCRSLDMAKVSHAYKPAWPDWAAHPDSCHTAGMKLPDMAVAKGRDLILLLSLSFCHTCLALELYRPMQVHSMLASNHGHTQRVVIDVLESRVVRVQAGDEEVETGDAGIADMAQRRGSKSELLRGAGRQSSAVNLTRLGRDPDLKRIIEEVCAQRRDRLHGDSS